jgi:hypothetical protein
MHNVPTKLKNDFGKFYLQRFIPNYNHNFYQKWLRFYIDFYQKYREIIKKTNPMNVLFYKGSFGKESRRHSTVLSLKCFRKNLR